MSKRENEQNQQLNECVLNWVEKLSSHFNVPQDEEQIKIFVHALRNCTTWQVEQAFERCLNECQFMPKLADVHQRMPEQRYPAENPGRFVLYGPPTLDLVRPIAREICKGMTGREYDSLDVKQDGQLIHEIFAAANRIRYERIAEGK